MDAEMTPALAFMAGLSGAGHCWAMCGGFAGGLFLGRSRTPPWLAQSGYHGGRVLAYVLVGALAAGVGQAIVLTGGVGRTQGGLYIVAGVLVVLAGLRVMGLLPWPVARASAKARASGACAAPGAALRERAPWRWPLAGFLNGLMPCALVFSLALKAATAPSIPVGAAWLFAFGLGTVPAMGLAAGLAQALGRSSLPWLRRLAGLAVMGLGLQAILAGAKFFHVMLHL
jgi:sulfite exporter TauE/SafE